jgi:hypothetical protein
VCNDEAAKDEMIESLQICNIGPLLPAIGLGLSALALIATLWMSLRLSTLEMREEVAQEIAEIKAQRGGIGQDGQATRRPGHGNWLSRYRLLVLIPSLLLLLGNSALLYVNSINDCTAVDQGDDSDS